MNSTIRNESLCATIEVNAAVPLLCINGSRYNYGDIREAELLHSIINYHPNILTYEQIVENILKKYGISNDPYADPIHYIRKKKLSLCKLLSQATGFQKEDIIINVRKVGYRLNTGWERVDRFPSEDKTSVNVEDETSVNSEYLLLAEIRNLKHIIEDVINLSNLLQFNRISNDQQNVILVLNHKGYEQDIAVLEKRFERIVRSITGLLNINPVNGRHMRILRILEVIFSYVTMSRQGSNITEETWRMLFDHELKNHYESLTTECISPYL